MRHAHEDPLARALFLQELACEYAVLATDYMCDVYDEDFPDDEPDWTPEERADFARHACKFQRQSAMLYDLARFDYLRFHLAGMKRL